MKSTDTTSPYSWSWDTTASVNEETEDPGEAPGLGAGSHFTVVNLEAGGRSFGSRAVSSSSACAR